MIMEGMWFAFCLTFLAGMATGLGSLVAFVAKRTNYRFLAVATGFSAGVMLYVSFVEILAKGRESLAEVYGHAMGDWINIAAFFCGILLIAVIDRLVPERENPHEAHSQKEIKAISQQMGNVTVGVGSVDCARNTIGPEHQHGKLLRLGLFTALAISIHNFPEGLATFLAALHDPSLGLAIAVAIALHNIPEGISVAIPIYYATGSRGKALFYSFLSGLAEPFGALIALLILRLVAGQGELPPQIMGISFGVIAGIMVYISLDELLPTSRAYGKGHDSMGGLVAGMAVMALSLLLM